MEVPIASPAPTFEIQVAPGTYQVVAFSVGSEPQTSRLTAAYSSSSGIEALTVTAGQVLEGIIVKNINPDNCVKYPFPASPDGRFPALEENCSKLPTEIAPATMVYFIGGEHMYPLEVPAENPVATFEQRWLQTPTSWWHSPSAVRTSQIAPLPHIPAGPGLAF